jgi:hypothetical protein
MAQPLIEQYNNKKALEQQKKEENSPDAIKEKRTNYVKDKLNIIGQILNIALAMKDITNEMASDGQFTRYIKQIDIDNAEGDSLNKLIQRQGVNGLANGLEDRLTRLNERIDKYNLDKGLKATVKRLKGDCKTLKEMHTSTKKLISLNKQEEVREEKEQKETEKQRHQEEIAVVSEEELEDAIAIEEPQEDIAVVSEEELEDAIALEEVLQEAEEQQQAEPAIPEDNIENAIEKEIVEISDEDKKLINESKRLTRIMKDQGHINRAVREALHFEKSRYPGGILAKTKEETLKKYSKEEFESNFRSYIELNNDNESFTCTCIVQDWINDTWKRNGINASVFNLARNKASENEIMLLDIENKFIDIVGKALYNKIVEKYNSILNGYNGILTQDEREKMLEDFYHSSWHKSANAYYDEYYSFGDQAYNDFYRQERRKTMREYEGLSDEEFKEKLNNARINRLVNTRREKTFFAFAKEIIDVYLQDNGLTLDDIVVNYHNSLKKGLNDGEAKSWHYKLAAEYLRNNRSDLLELDENEFNNVIKAQKSNFYAELKNDIQLDIQNIIDMIDNLSIEDISKNKYYELQLNPECRDIIFESKKRLEYKINMYEIAYSVYVKHDLGLGSLNEIDHQLLDRLNKKEKELIKEVKNNNANNQNSIYNASIQDILDSIG